MMFHEFHKYPIGSMCSFFTLSDKTISVCGQQHFAWKLTIILALLSFLASFAASAYSNSVQSAISHSFGCFQKNKTVNMMLNMGPNTHSVPVSMFKDNRERVVAELKKHSDVTNNAYVLLQGGDSINLYNTDVEYVFRQVSFVLFILN